MTNVAKFFNRRPTKGEVGVELEYEGNDLPQTGFERFWTKCADGSLRGESAEYILTSPISRKDVKAALEELESSFKASKTLVKDTFRAGTHIHINVQELTLPQVINFLTIYFMFETTLIKLCREDRLGNHFCLRSRDASGLISMLYKAVTTSDTSAFSQDLYRYGAVNVTSLPKFGSLEFRALESTTDWEKVVFWVNAHLSIKDAAVSYRDPATILGEASAIGFKEFGKKVFGDSWAVLEKVYQEQDVHEGIWEIQSVVFSRDWAKANLNIFSLGNIFDITP